MRGSAVVSTSACHAGGRGSLPGSGTLLGVKTWLSTLEIQWLCISVSFGWDTKSRWSLLSGVYARGSKRSHQTALEMCNLSWTPQYNSLNHSCVSPNMGCLEYSGPPLIRPPIQQALRWPYKGGGLCWGGTSFSGPTLKPDVITMYT